MTEGSKETDWLAFCNVSFHDCFSLFCAVVFLHQRKCSICLELNWTLRLVSLSCCICVRFLKQHFEERFQGLHYAVFLPLHCCTLFPHTFCFHHIFCFCIYGENNWDGRGDLPADWLIIHHHHFVFTVHSGWVSCSNLRIPRGTTPWLSGRRHLWSTGKWTAVLLLARCQTSCLPAPPDPARRGWNANRRGIGALSLEYSPKCH